MVYATSGICQHSVIYFGPYEVHLNQLSCSCSGEYIYIGVSFFLRANYRIYAATIYVINLPENLPFLSILFYVIRTRFDKVTVLSFWYSFHSVQNRCKQFDRVRGEVVCTYRCFPTPPKDDVRQGSSEPQRRFRRSLVHVILWWCWETSIGTNNFTACAVKLFASVLNTVKTISEWKYCNFVKSHPNYIK